MTQRVRFVDSVSYTEADQSDFNMRMMRPQGVIPDSALGLLALSAPGGMTVRIGPGEAFIQGFQYLNDANVDLGIAANSSGSTRIDTIVLSLNRTGNTLLLAVVQGIAGAGAPTLTQIAGGNWQFPLANITVANAAASIVGGNIADLRVFSRWPLTSLVPNVTANPMTTDGDLIVGGAAGAPTRMPVGGASRVFGVNAAGVLGYYPVTSDLIQDGSIVNGDIAAQTIRGGVDGANSRIVPGSLVGSDIAAGTIGTTQIADRGILAGDIAVGNITTTEIQDRGILGGDIAVGAITGTEIANRTVGTVNIVVGAVGVNELADGNVTNGKIADNSISAAKIQAANVTTDKLAANAASSVVQVVSASAFAISGINNWAYDSATMTLTVTLNAAGFIHVMATGSFYATGATGAAAFGIVRVGVHSVPPYYVVQYFPSLNAVVSVACHHSEQLPAGSHTFYFGMTASSPSLTINSWTSNRYMVAQVHHR